MKKSFGKLLLARPDPRCRQVILYYLMLYHTNAISYHDIIYHIRLVSSMVDWLRPDYLPPGYNCMLAGCMDGWPGRWPGRPAGLPTSCPALPPLRKGCGLQSIESTGLSLAVPSILALADVADLFFMFNKLIVNFIAMFSRRG